MVGAVAEAARRYGVLLACVPVAEGVVASVGVGYLAHVGEGSLELCRADAVQPRLGQVALGPLDAADGGVVGLSERVLKGFRRKTGRECARRALLACSSDDPSAPEAVHRYLRLGFSRPHELHARATDKRVLAVDDLARHVLSEVEHARQFARFSRRADGSWVAAIEPAADVVPLAAPHFARRMGTERFCLVDPAHRVAAFHEARAARCTVVRLDEGLSQRLAALGEDDLADDERYVRALWKRFYDHASLPGREAEERGYDLRTKFVPVRLRGRMTELDPRSDNAGAHVPARYAGGGERAASPECPEHAATHGIAS